MTSELRPSLFHLACLCAAVWLGAAVARGADSATYDLGGPRQVKAEVQLQKGDYTVKVSMRPVRVFDAALNAEVNREKSRLYALQALARHLSKEPTVELTVSGATIADAGLEGERYVLTLRVPQRGVALPGDKQPDMEGERVRYTDAFLRARQDHENTAAQLASRLAASLRDAEKSARKTKADPELSIRSVQMLVKDGQNQFDKLADAIKADLLVSSVGMFGKPSEKDELLELIARHRRECEERAAEAIRRLTPKKNKESP